MIKCNNIQEQAIDLSELIFKQWQNVLTTGYFVLGEEVSRLEKWMSQLIFVGVHILFRYK
ncbi:hypothetical protein V2H77_17210 [Photorhabdus sp. P32]